MTAIFVNNFDSSKHLEEICASLGLTCKKAADFKPGWYGNDAPDTKYIIENETRLPDYVVCREIERMARGRLLVDGLMLG